MAGLSEKRKLDNKKRKAGSNVEGNRVASAEPTAGTKVKKKKKTDVTVDSKGLKAIPEGSGGTEVGKDTKKKKKKKNVKSSVEAEPKMKSNGKFKPGGKSSCSGGATSSVDIDDMFATMATKKQANKQKQEEEEIEARQAAEEERRQEEAYIKQSTFGKPSRYDSSGMPIYTEESLGLGSGGGDTDLCPFDCNCCF